MGTGHREGRISVGARDQLPETNKDGERSDLGLDEGGEGEVIKEIGEVTPYVGVPVFSETFVVESIHLGNLSGFVVPAKDSDAIAIPEFHGHQKGDGLDGIVASVDVITHEEVVGVRRVAADAKQF